MNYTRNVVDINTCKVPELIEHGRMLSYGLDHLKNAYEFLPLRIRCLVDIFSINPEYLVGNFKNHILSDNVIREILVYVRDNNKDRTLFSNDDVIDKLIDNPHGLLVEETYRNFIVQLFFSTIVQALEAKYNSGLNQGEDDQPIVFNMLHEERKIQDNVLSRIDEYKTWVDKYISNEIEHPWNSEGMDMYGIVRATKATKKMSSKFNPFKLADEIYFNGLNPTSKLSQDELDLIGRVMEYHSRTKYDYEERTFSSDESTKYAYYKELEFCEFVKMVMFVMNNLDSFNNEMTYATQSNKFVQELSSDKGCTRVVQIFCKDGKYVVEDVSTGKVAIDYSMILKVAKFLAKYVFNIQMVRENMKTISQKHAIRGTSALLVHMVNDYLVKELPNVRDFLLEQDESNVALPPLKFGWDIGGQFRNHGNVKVLEYEDDNEYFNIEPTEDVRFTERTNARYWEQLEGMDYGDSIGVFTKGQIRQFYKDVLGMGRLQPEKPRDYDYICDFLVDLFKVGANPISRKDGQLENPIDDIIKKSEDDYGYTKEERIAVQQNTELRKNQERQFLEYFGEEQDDFLGQGIYDYMNNRLFYWKNTDYSSHVLHPFMYNLKLWNKLNNIIVNGYKDYANSDMEDLMMSKVKFNELFGEYGECRNFWKYNVMDLTGYTTRYEAAVKSEHLDDDNGTISQLTGYDGLFYPDAAREFLDILGQSTNFSITEDFFEHSVHMEVKDETGEKKKIDGAFADDDKFVAAIYSIYWQEEKTQFATVHDGKYVRDGDPVDSFYTRWYSHLNYTRSEYQKIALQLWYWRDRIKELISTEYPIVKYCLDIRGNSLMLVSTFNVDEIETSQYLVDLQISQNHLQDSSGNENREVPFCDNNLVKPCELWIRWKSNPIAVPALDVWYDEDTGDAEFDTRYRNGQNIEMGQLTHTNNDCNDMFKVVLDKWRTRYGLVAKTTSKVLANRLPVFFDMEQSANILALSSWYELQDNQDGIYDIPVGIGGQYSECFCGKNPIHIFSVERVSTSPSEYNFTSCGIDLGKRQDMLFDRYHYCQADGSILVPTYRFDCGEQEGQTLVVRMTTVHAQMLKTQNNVSSPRSVTYDFRVDLNAMLDNQTRPFGHMVKVCRNTNVVFGPYDDNGMNKVRIALLGVF